MRLQSLPVLFSAGALALALTLPNPVQAQEAAPPPGGGGGGGGSAAPPAGGGGAGGGGTTPGMPTPGVPSPGTPGGRPGQGPTFPGPGQDRMPQMEMVRPIFLSGKVMTTDGGPPPESATIELVCMGIPRPQAYTNSKGNFSFQLGGQNNMVLPDASVSNSPMGDMGGFGGQNPNNMPIGGGGRMGVSERDLVGCEVRASLPGYRSESIPLAGRRLLDSPDLGTILMQRLGKVEGYTVSMTTANAPKSAKKAYEKGLKEANKRKFDSAEAEILKAVNEYPAYAVAWFDLGRIQESQDKKEEAQASFRKSIEADSRFIKPYLHLMQYDVQSGDWAKLEQTTSTLLKLNPYNYPQAWYYNSVAHLQLNQLDDAENSARQALKADDLNQIPKIRHVLGIILAQRNELPEALEHMKGYLERSPNAGDAPQVRNQMMEIERFLGQQAATPSAAPPQ
jgi:tetratricopeptide (TPR) repeat protein